VPQTDSLSKRQIGGRPRPYDLGESRSPLAGEAGTPALHSLVWNINMAVHKNGALLRPLAPDLAILPAYAAPDVIVAK
jgi:hypothetical protein